MLMDNDSINQQLEAFNNDSASSPLRHPQSRPSSRSPEPLATVGVQAAPLSKGKRKATDNPGEGPPQKKRRVAMPSSKQRQRQQHRGRRALPPWDCAAGSSKRRTRYKHV